jgi:hypothetical protein
MNDFMEVEENEGKAGGRRDRCVVVRANVVDARARSIQQFRWAMCEFQQSQIAL